ncbi:hypothetical protein MM236_07950 [Belliella sp. DSM 107340]|uniref:Uncharacterized protein n=1 Tax=Belliella calami TaxID=2923436 RepID=A0ABS9UMV4_9BACT|nr:hypothetical protein [Belliella calami]MCH7397917.1 hypothetical protein [Belliella calami]
MKYSRISLVLFISFVFITNVYAQAIKLENIQNIEMKYIQCIVKEDKIVIHDKRETEIYIYDMNGTLLNQRKMEHNFPGNGIFQIDISDKNIHLLLLSPYAISKQSLDLKSKDKSLVNMQTNKLKVFDFSSSVFLELSNGKYLASTLEYEYLNKFRKGNSLTIFDIKNNSNISFSEFPKFLSNGFYFFSGKQRFISFSNNLIYSYFNGDSEIKVYNENGSQINSIKLEKDFVPKKLYDASTKIELFRDFLSLSVEVKKNLTNLWAIDFSVNSSQNIYFVYQNLENGYLIKELDSNSGKILKTKEIKDYPINPVGFVNDKYYYIFKSDGQYFLKSI